MISGSFNIKGIYVFIILDNKDHIIDIDERNISKNKDKGFTKGIIRELNTNQKVIYIKKVIY